MLEGILLAPFSFIFRKSFELVLNKGNNHFKENKFYRDIEKSIKEFIENKDVCNDPAVEAFRNDVSSFAEENEDADLLKYIKGYHALLLTYDKQFDHIDNGRVQKVAKNFIAKELKLLKTFLLSLSDKSGKYLLAVFEMNDKEKQGSEALIDRANIKDAFNVLHECISEHLKLHPVKCNRCGAFIDVIERDKKGDILGIKCPNCDTLKKLEETNFRLEDYTNLLELNNLRKVNKDLEDINKRFSSLFDDLSNRVQNIEEKIDAFNLTLDELTKGYEKSKKDIEKHEKRISDLERKDAKEQKIKASLSEKAKKKYEKTDVREIAKLFQEKYSSEQEINSIFVIENEEYKDSYKIINTFASLCSSKKNFTKMLENYKLCLKDQVEKACSFVAKKSNKSKKAFSKLIHSKTNLTELQENEDLIELVKRAKNDYDKNKDSADLILNFQSALSTLEDKKLVERINDINNFFSTYKYPKFVLLDGGVKDHLDNVEALEKSTTEIGIKLNNYDDLDNYVKNVSNSIAIIKKDLNIEFKNEKYNHFGEYYFDYTCFNGLSKELFPRALNATLYNNYRYHSVGIMINIPIELQNEILAKYPDARIKSSLKVARKSFGLNEDLDFYDEKDMIAEKEVAPIALKKGGDINGKYNNVLLFEDLKFSKKSEVVYGKAKIELLSETKKISKEDEKKYNFDFFFTCIKKRILKYQFINTKILPGNRVSFDVLFAPHKYKHLDTISYYVVYNKDRIPVLEQDFPEDYQDTSQFLKEKDNKLLEVKEFFDGRQYKNYKADCKVINGNDIANNCRLVFKEPLMNIFYRAECVNFSKDVNRPFNTRTICPFCGEKLVVNKDSLLNKKKYPYMCSKCQKEDKNGNPIRDEYNNPIRFYFDKKIKNHSLHTLCLGNRAAGKSIFLYSLCGINDENMFIKAYGEFYYLASLLRQNRIDRKEEREDKEEEKNRKIASTYYAFEKDRIYDNKKSNLETNEYVYTVGKTVNSQTHREFFLRLSKNPLAISLNEMENIFLYDFPGEMTDISKNEFNDKYVQAGYDKKIDSILLFIDISKEEAVKDVADAIKKISYITEKVDKNIPIAVIINQIDKKIYSDYKRNNNKLFDQTGFNYQSSVARMNYFDLKIDEMMAYINSSSDEILSYLYQEADENYRGIIKEIETKNVKFFACSSIFEGDLVAVSDGKKVVYPPKPIKKELPFVWFLYLKGWLKK